MTVAEGDEKRYSQYVKECENHGCEARVKSTVAQSNHGRAGFDDLGYCLVPRCQTMRCQKHNRVWVVVCGGSFVLKVCEHSFMRH